MDLKNKTFVKIVSVIAVVACSFTMFAGCEGKGIFSWFKKCKEHDVGKWDIITYPTCIAEGMEKGICAECLETVERSIAINPDAHDYSEWQVVAPTEKSTGTAKKVCSLNASHNISVNLPKLTSDKYSSSVTKLPTAGSDGERTYVYEHLLGEIKFVTKISASGIQSVRDAVDVASSKASHDSIRSAEGHIGYEYHRPQMDYYYNPSDGTVQEPWPADDRAFDHTYNYTFGDNYTYINGGTFDASFVQTENEQVDVGTLVSTERWYGRDGDGEVFGYAQSGSNFYDEIARGVSGAENYIDGFRFVLMYETDLGAFYGAENLLAGLYQTARLSTNEDFKEDVKTINNEKVYTFSFGHYDNVANGDFGNVQVQFTLSSEYTIKSLDVKSVIYINRKDLNTSTNGQFDTWELTTVNGKQVARLKDGKILANSARYVDYISITQKTHAEANALGEPLPTNPYSPSSVLESFDLVYNNQVINDGDIIHGRASRGGADDIVLSVANKFPENTSEKDSIHLYYLDDDGVETLMDYSSIDSVGINCYESGGKFTIRSHRAGEVTVVARSAKVKKILKFNFERIAPSKLYASAYQYTKAGYILTRPSVDSEGDFESSMGVTVYVGQPFYFRADPPAIEENYVDGTVKQPRITGGDSSVCTLVANETNLPNTVNTEGKQVASFISSAVGTYTITMESVKSSGIRSTIVVNVVDIPDIENTVLDGGYYIGTMKELNKGIAKVTFAKSGNVTINATVNYDDKDIKLECEYDSVLRKLTSKISEENNLNPFADRAYMFSLSLNEAYDLVLTRPTGNYVQSFDGEEIEIFDSVILTRDYLGYLKGEYTSNKGANVAFDTEDNAVIATVNYKGQEIKLLCSVDIHAETLTTEVILKQDGDGNDIPIEDIYKFALYFNEKFEIVLYDPGVNEEIILRR